jgi:hypothetical protein
MPEIEYLPYKAINVFIDRDYLEHTLEMILKEKQKLPKEDQIEFTKAFKQYVNILGFRNATRAPLRLQVNALASAFEEKDEVVLFTLSTWTKLNIGFAEKVKDWLESNGWENLALERKYNETEGFINKWPEKLTFEKLEQEFNKVNTDLEFTRDDLILMVLWISGQLPEQQSE